MEGSISNSSPPSDFLCQLTVPSAMGDTRTEKRGDRVSIYSVRQYRGEKVNAPPALGERMRYLASSDGGGAIDDMLCCETWISRNQRRRSHAASFLFLFYVGCALSLFLASQNNTLLPSKEAAVNSSSVHSGKSFHKHPLFIREIFCLWKRCKSAPSKEVSCLTLHLWILRVLVSQCRVPLFH